MSVTMFSEMLTNTYIELEATVRNGRTVYKVARFSRIYDDNRVGYPDKELWYGEFSKARATYNRWLRKYA